jgi:ketosteroid isomerase-like protein
VSGGHLSLEDVDAQEERFATAFAAGDISGARNLYASDVVYLSPTTRLFGWPARIMGVAKTFEFIQLTITGLVDISYAVDERALIGPGASAYVRVRFDFGSGGARVRSTYVVVYRYRDGLIAQQELYYDPSGALERVSTS